VYAYLIIRDPFLEAYISAPPELCAQRNPKSMYAVAQRGETLDFTGVSSTYVEPAAALITRISILCPGPIRRALPSVKQQPPQADDDHKRTQHTADDSCKHAHGHPVSSGVVTRALLNHGNPRTPHEERQQYKEEKREQASKD
jgi:hypothetical protein